MNKYICIHGHFYQPPREDPWLEEIEKQNSAYPYHDWNKRITAECYEQNTASRILDASGKIIKIINNYTQISFNFGPTLMSWIAKKQPALLTAILNADKESQERFDRHGAAIAQAYNHMILPLANSRDKYTQILWGIRDFEFYFGRPPEGLWLPETAVDLESLDIMAELGIKFTILAPRQARRIRSMDSDNNPWQEVNDGNIDTTLSYLQKLPSGRSIALFFYDGQVSQAVAFEKLLQNGEVFADYLTKKFSETKTNPQLIHIATDGETYGHHQAHGDMALAYALETIQTRRIADVVIYGQYLEKHPPAWEVEIIENSSWSCVHGVERWKNNCGCNSGNKPEWNQAWRAPLREALDCLRDELMLVYEQESKNYLQDPWAARNAYISVIHNRSKKNINQFLSEYARQNLTQRQKQTVFQWLELQRHTMLMYTSCGWFFDELSGIETVQIIQYAARVIQLANDLCQNNYEKMFLDKLQNAPSNIPDISNGRKIYEKYIKSRPINLKLVAAHYAIRSLFKPYKENIKIFSYKIKRLKEHRAESGKLRLVTGSIVVTSIVTLETACFNYVVIHYSDQNLTCAVNSPEDAKVFSKIEAAMFEKFSQGDFIAVLKLIDIYFESSIYSIKDMFADEQANVLNRILEFSLTEARNQYELVYEHHAPMMDFLLSINAVIPIELKMAAEYVINANIKKEFNKKRINIKKLDSLFLNSKRLNINLDKVSIEFILSHKLDKLISKFYKNNNAFLLEQLIRLIHLVVKFSFNINLWRAQNMAYCLLNNSVPDFRKSVLFSNFKKLCGYLKVKID